MAKGPLAASHRAAITATRELGQIFNYLGNTRHMNGKVLVAYRNALRAIKTSLRGNGVRRTVIEIAAVNEALIELEVSLRVTAETAIARGEAVGTKSAVTQLAAYEIPLVSEQVVTGNITSDAVAGAMTEYERQAQLVKSLAITGASVELIIGDIDRQGVLRPAPFIRNTADWVALTAATVMKETADATQQEFQKQAISAWDGRTTETCLRVNGQIQDLNKDFFLEAEPRYADHLDWAPFHWWCRTSVVLYQKEFDFGLTEQIQSNAQMELERRYAKTGKYKPTQKSPTSGLVKKK